MASILGSDPVAEILKRNHTIGVVGLILQSIASEPWCQRIHAVGGYRIIPVNPHETEVLGEKSYADLEKCPSKSKS